MTAMALAAVALGLLALPASGARIRIRSALRPRSVVDTPAARRPHRRPAGSDELCVAANWDLLAACLRAGLPVADAVRAVADGLPPDATDALVRTGELIALGAGPDEAWEPASACPATAPLARAARRTARSGTALANTVADLAERARARTHETAETRAQRAGVLVTGPLGLCFLPAFLCLGVIPVVLGLAAELTITR